jgi:hypothetical protein
MQVADPIRAELVELLGTSPIAGGQTVDLDRRPGRHGRRRTSEMSADHSRRFEHRENSRDAAADIGAVHCVPVVSEAPHEL